MKSFLVILLVPVLAFAHVGSPNVFFTGRAGAEPVTVVIRPPATLPGIAHVDVRVESAEVSRVSVRALFSGTGPDAAPVATELMRSSGDPLLFAAQVWLLRSGSYTVEVTAESPSGGGVTKVPLDSAVIVRPAMPPGLQGILIALGCLLVGSAILIVRSLGRESCLAPAVIPTRREMRRGRVAAIVAAFAVGSSLCAGGLRWRSMDREFRSSAMVQPIPVDALVRTRGNLHILRLARRAAGKHRDWQTLVTDHGKLMHLFLVRDGDQNVFAHLHPVRRDGSTFEGVLPPLPASSYHVYGELTYEDGSSETLVGNVSLPMPIRVAAQAPFEMANEVWCQSGVVFTGNAAEPLRMDADDSWHASPSGGAPSRIAPLMGGNRMVFENVGELTVDEETTLRFAVFSPGGDAVPIQTYMGMLGHAVVRRADGEVFTHLHPVGTISMAAQEILARGEKTNEATPARVAPAAATTALEVTFPYAFPSAGEYRIWLQVRVEGRVLTGVFDVRVKPKA